MSVVPSPVSVTSSTIALGGRPFSAITSATWSASSGSASCSGDRFTLTGGTTGPRSARQSATSRHTRESTQ